MDSHARIREAAFDTSLAAQVIVDSSGAVVLANERVRMMFDLTSRDIGRPLRDLELSFRPVELLSCIEHVYTERRLIVLKDIEWITIAGEIRYLEVQIMPLLDAQVNLLGISISFNDVSRYRQLQQELEHSNQELEMAYEELQSTNQELETTKEELQSTIEELETTNEELQSTNEELETMNEELQSINEELRCRSEELNEVNTLGVILLMEEQDEANG